MENSYKYLKNIDCKYFPCHKGMLGEEFNCLFCYCPMNRFEDCPGNPVFRESKGRRIKDCSHCTFPHEPENYEAVMDFLKSKRWRY